MITRLLPSRTTLWKPFSSSGVILYVAHVLHFNLWISANTVLPEQVLVKGKKRKDTVLIVLADDDLDDGSVRINRVVRHNLRVKHGDIVTVHACPDIKYVCRLSLT